MDAILLERATVVRIAYLVFAFAAAYCTLWLLIGASMLPGGAGWALTLLYLCSVLVGKLMALLSKRLPPLLGTGAAGEEGSGGGLA